MASADDDVLGVVVRQRSAQIERRNEAVPGRGPPTAADGGTCLRLAHSEAGELAPCHDETLPGGAFDERVVGTSAAPPREPQPGGPRTDRATDAGLREIEDVFEVPVRIQTTHAR